MKKSTGRAVEGEQCQLVRQDLVDTLAAGRSSIQLPEGKTVKLLSTLAVAAFLVSCGGGTPPNTIYDDGDQATAHCADPAFNNGPGGDGALCDNAKFDCAVVCCGCDGDPDTFWASECYRGRCDQEDVCNDACAARQ